MFRKLAAIANLKTMPVPKKAILGLGGLGAAGLGIKSYMDSVSMPPSEELLMMDLPVVPEDKAAALVNEPPGLNASMFSTSVEPLPSTPIGMDERDMYGTVSLNPTPNVASSAPSGESDAPMSEAPSVTGNKGTSSARGGVKNASFLDEGILPAAAGGIGGFLIGEHFIAPHFARQQAAIAEQIAQGQSAMATAARNQRISPILAAAAGALLLSWLLSNKDKKQEIKNSVGNQYHEGMQGFDPQEQRQVFSQGSRHLGY
jgi:hypothetical protein